MMYGLWMQIIWSGSRQNEGETKQNVIYSNVGYIFATMSGNQIKT